MKIVNQSYEIFKEYKDDNPLTEKDLIQKIGLASRICYKSESKNDETKFVKGLLKNGHNSCFEMASIFMTVKLYEHDHDILRNFLSCDIPFLKIDFKIKDYEIILYVSGSVRAFREVIMTHIDMNYIIINSISKKLNEIYPILFNNYESHGDDDLYHVNIENINTHESEYAMSDGIYKRHCYQAVKFITNRAVSHELVRHRSNGILQESQRYCCYSNEKKFGNEVTFIQPTAFFYSMNGIGYSDWKETMEFCEKKYFKLLKEGISTQAARILLPNSCKTEIIIYADLRQWEHIFKTRALNSKADPSMLEAMIPVYNAFLKIYPNIFKEPKVKICS